MDLLSQAATELEDLRRWKKEANNQGPSSRDSSPKHKRFPAACICLLRNIPGNLRCADCGATNPQWASITFGALLCIDCSGKHRQMGVQISIVRSISMDDWSHKEVLSMLEGGNNQLNDFFARHGLPAHHQSSFSDIPALPADHLAVKNRYRTNAAVFYRNNLFSHVKKIEESGLYQGRDHSRQPRRKKETSTTSDGSSTPSNASIRPMESEFSSASSNTDAYTTTVSSS